MTLDPEQEKRQHKQTAIRQAAYACFSASGYHDTKVEDICAAASISKGSFYWYYAGKREVFLAILDTWASEVEAELASHFKNALAPKTRFVNTTDALLRQAKRNRRLMPLWLDFIAQSRREPEVRAGLREFHSRIRTAIVRLLTPHLAPAFSPEHIEATAATILGGFMGLMSQDLTDDVGFDPHLTLFMQVLQRALRPLASERPSLEQTELLEPQLLQSPPLQPQGLPQ
jgi:AcrR family transcriptional regulator